MPSRRYKEGRSRLEAAGKWRVTPRSAWEYLKFKREMEICAANTLSHHAKALQSWYIAYRGRKSNAPPVGFRKLNTIEKWMAEEKVKDKKRDQKKDPHRKVHIPWSKEEWTSLNNAMWDFQCKDPKALNDVWEQNQQLQLRQDLVFM